MGSNSRGSKRAPKVIVIPTRLVAGFKGTSMVMGGGPLIDYSQTIQGITQPLWSPIGR
jgi:hypothetical protein